MSLPSRPHACHVQAAGGGRDGTVVTSTNSLSLDLEWPADPSATNPEELFAAGYSACFNGKRQRA